MNVIVIVIKHAHQIVDVETKVVHVQSVDVLIHAVVKYGNYYSK